MITKMSRVGLKTRSLFQMFKNQTVCSGGHIISLILLKVGHNVCLKEISHELKNGYVGSKTRSLGQILKDLVYMLEATVSARYP